MIVYALIVRSKDGLALSASTDFNDEANKFLKDSKRYVKMVANKAAQLSERCTLKLGNYSIYMITCAGVAYVVLCESQYPMVLAFSFLNELMREFAVKYEPSKVHQARRPYLFIEFDSTIHKIRQRYNKPQSLTTKVNISELNVELQLHPPLPLSFSDIESGKNGYTKSIHTPKLGVGPPPKLEPLSWCSVISIIPAVLLILLGFYRGFSALQVASIEVYSGPSPTHGLVFAFDSIFRMFQLYLLLYQSRYRVTESWICLVVLVLLILPVRDLRDTYQHVFFFGSALAVHVCTIRRKLQPKLPDYNV